MPGKTAPARQEKELEKAASPGLEPDIERIEYSVYSAHHVLTSLTDKDISAVWQHIGST